jgi:rubrerythrin
VNQPTTRRNVLRLAALGAGAVATPALLRPARASAQSGEDEDLRDFLEEAIDLEQAAEFAYETAAKAKDLDPQLKRSFERFRDQEQAHATALRQALDSLGFDLPDEVTDASDSELLKGLDGLKTGDEYLKFLIGLEDDQVKLYVEQTPDLDSQDMGRTGAEILGCQAEHLVVLHEAEGASPAEAAAAVAAVGERATSAP